MCKLKTFVIALILLEIIFSAQFTVVSAQDSQGTRKALINKTGWIVTGRNDFKQEVKVIEKDIEGIQVTQRILKSLTEIIVDVSGRRIEPFDKHKSNNRIFSVRGFSVYEIKGRVFAYSVSLVPI